MRIVTAVLALAFVSLGTLSGRAQEFTEEQQEPWSALERQVALFMERDWEKHDQYIHPKAIIGGEDLPVPVTPARSNKYTETLLATSGDVLAHYLTPVTVTVAGDVAIINAYLRVLAKKDEKLIESTYRLHNTWKKENGRWQLLATYNGQVGEPKTVD